VLLAEDNLSNQEIAARALRGAGAEVVIADDGSKAAQAAVSQPFDVVVMDIQMPVMNGVEATRAIRSHPALINLPIIGLSASAVVGDRDNCIAAGMTEYVTKPIAPNALVAVVARHTHAAIRTLTPAASDNDAVALSSGLVAIAAAGFDVQRGLIMTGGEAQYGRTLERFIADTQRVVSQVRQMLARGDIAGATRAVHGITGDAGLLGADAIRRAALAVEKAIFAGDTDREKLLAELDALLGKARSDLAAGDLIEHP
jgi:two-component system, sensor histidine kinase and response regulator